VQCVNTYDQSAGAERFNPGRSPRHPCGTLQTVRSALEKNVVILFAITEVAHRSDSHSHGEVIPFPRITSSVNALFSRLPNELGRQNEHRIYKIMLKDYSFNTILGSQLC
jgi:hypothetical protein